MHGEPLEERKCLNGNVSETFPAHPLKRREDATVTVDSWDDFRDLFPEGQSKFVYAHWCGDAEVEKQIKEETGGVTIRNIPVDQPAEPGECIRTGRPSKQRVLFARAY